MGPVARRCWAGMPSEMWCGLAASRRPRQWGPATSFHSAAGAASWSDYLRYEFVGIHATSSGHHGPATWPSPRPLPGVRSSHATYAARRGIWSPIKPSRPDIARQWPSMMSAALKLPIKSSFACELLMGEQPQMGSGSRRRVCELAAPDGGAAGDCTGMRSAAFARPGQSGEGGGSRDHDVRTLGNFSSWR